MAELAAYVDEKMRLAEIESPAGDTLKLSVLAALNIADEYFRMREEGRRQQDSVTERAGALERMLDLALGLEPPQAVARYAELSRLLRQIPHAPSPPLNNGRPIEAHNSPTMQARAFWKAVTVDGSDFLDRFIALLATNVFAGVWLTDRRSTRTSIRSSASIWISSFAAGSLESLEPLLASRFRVERFPHSLNLAAEGSDLRIQIQTDPRYESFVDTAQPREVLGVLLPVARVDDVLRGKVWAVEDPGRRPSKRQKDLADIARILERSPDLQSVVPATVLNRLLS